MDFALTDTQKEIAELAGRILGSTREPETLWARAAEAGLLGVAVADDVGGAGQGLLEWCSLLAAAGGAAAPIPLWAVTCAAMAIDRFGTPAQRTALLPDLLAGRSLITPAFAEPDGRDPRAPSTRAAGGALTGVKTCVPAADRAVRLLVPATTDAGAALFLVDPRAAGVTVDHQVATSGEVQGLVSLRGAQAEQIGPADGSAIDWLVDRATLGLCALELGIVERVLGMTAKYTSERVQFERPIATFQAVAQRAADAYIDVEVIRLTLWQAAWRLAGDLPAARELAIAKFFAAEAGQRVTYAAQHLHGGIGFDLDYPLARYYPLSKQLELTLGGAGEQLDRLGRLLAGS